MMSITTHKPPYRMYSLDKCYAVFVIVKFWFDFNIVAILFIPFFVCGRDARHMMDWSISKWKINQISESRVIYIYVCLCVFSGYLLRRSINKNTFCGATKSLKLGLNHICGLRVDDGEWNTEGVLLIGWINKTQK